MVPNMLSTLIQLQNCSTAFAAIEGIPVVMAGLWEDICVELVTLTLLSGLEVY